MRLRCSPIAFRPAPEHGDDLRHDRDHHAGARHTIANVALPYMQGTLSASRPDQLVLTSYIVAAAS